MKQSRNPKLVLGRSEHVEFPEIDLSGVPARIDTGAKTSALWATDVREESDGCISFLFFDESSAHHKPERHYVETYQRISVKSTIGATEERYKIRLLVSLAGRRIRASFTLANRSQQVYPVLIGRNILAGKFVVDVSIDGNHAQNNTLPSTEHSKGDHA